MLGGLESPREVYQEKGKGIETKLGNRSANPDRCDGTSGAGSPPVAEPAQRRKIRGEGDGIDGGNDGGDDSDGHEEMQTLTDWRCSCRPLVRQVIVEKG